ELAEQTLFIENEKLRAGRSSNFELVSFQNSLVTAENSEVDAIIAYHNALTSLDEFLGTTLDTWGIEIQNITRKSDINKISDIPEIEEINFDQKK
ncbi:MAG: TolC family protein, partial [Gammaproteobacteria bacterium]